MKPVVIYHANCADGFGAAFAAWLKMGDEAEYVACQYGKDYALSENTFEFKGREIYILDFSFPRDIMDMLFTGAKRVVWLDHHKTAFEMWCAPHLRDTTFFINQGDTEVGQKDHYILLDNNKSGAYLAWEYFHPGTEVPMLIKHIDDRDRWQFKIPGTKEFNAALWSYAPWSFGQWSQFLEDTGFSANDGTGIDAWYREGAAILRAHEQNVQSVVKGATRKCEINFDTVEDAVTNANLVWNNGGYYMLPGLAANCPPHLTSDVGHELATKSGTFGLCWTLSQTDLVAKCSLRSNAPYDVSAIAKSFGGGGHAQAAGFEVPITTLLGWLK